MEHFTITITQCTSGVLSDQLTLGLFLKNLSAQSGEKLLEGAVVQTRVGVGQVGFCATAQGTIVAETFLRQKQLLLVFSFGRPVDTARLQKYIISQLSLKPQQIILHLFSSQKEEIECEEPRCVNRATKDWGGRHLCSDHFDYYREEHFKFLRENQDS